MFRDEIFMPSGQGCFLFIDGGLLWRNFTSKVKVRFSCKHGNDDYSIHLTDRYIVLCYMVFKKPKVLNYIYMYEDIDILVKFLKVIDKVWFFLFFSSLEGILCIWISKFCLISLESQEWWRNLTRILGRLTLCLLCERRRSVEMRKRFQTPIVAIATSMTYICWSKKR